MISVLFFSEACSSSEEEVVVQRKDFARSKHEIPKNIDPRTITSLRFKDREGSEIINRGYFAWGDIKEYYKDGDLVRKDYYYYSWAKLKMREYYEKGRLHGIKTTWIEEGQIDASHSWIKRKIDDIKNSLRGYKIPIGGLETETEYVKGKQVKFTDYRK